MRVNFHSDFDFIIKLTVGGEEISFPDWDWRCDVFTEDSPRPYRASCIDGNCINCYNDEGRIHITCDNHRLRPGLVHIHFRAMPQETTFADGNKLTASIANTSIVLVEGNGDTLSKQAIVDVKSDDILTYIKELIEYEKLKERDDIYVAIYSSSGCVIHNGQGNVILTAVAYRAGVEITGLTDNQYTWKRITQDAESDTAWNAKHVGCGPTVTVSALEIWEHALFECEVTIEQ